MQHLRRRLPAVSKSSRNLPDESTSLRNATLKAMSRENRESDSSIRKYVYERRKGKYFEEQVFRFGRAYTLLRISSGYFLNPYRLLLRESSRNERGNIRAANRVWAAEYIWMAALSFSCRVIDEATETKWNSEKKHASRRSPLFSYFGNYPLLAYAHGNLPCY